MVICDALSDMAFSVSTLSMKLHYNYQLKSKKLAKFPYLHFDNALASNIMSRKHSVFDLFQQTNDGDFHF